MKMQNLDFTVIHIPGKENVADYMSRHALPDSEKTGVEKHVKTVTEADHAVVLEKIAIEIEQDTELQHLKYAMQTGAWDKKDPILKPYIRALRIRKRHSPTEQDHPPRESTSKDHTNHAQARTFGTVQDKRNDSAQVLVARNEHRD